VRCSICESDPTYKKEWGCDEPSQVAVWVDGEDEYYSCPYKFVSENVKYWYAKFSYCQRFPGTAPTYEEASPRFIEAICVYEAACVEFQELLHPRKDKTADNLQVLRQSFMNRKKDQPNA